MSRGRQKLSGRRAEDPVIQSAGEDQRRVRGAPARGSADDPGRARAVHRTGALDGRRTGGRAAAAGAGRPVRRRHVHRRSPAVAAGGQHGRAPGRRRSTSAPPMRGRRSPTCPESCWREERADLDIAEGPDAVLALGHRTAIARLLAAAGRTRAELSAIGIGLPGPVEHSHRSGDQPADHARVGPLRRAEPRPAVLRRPGAHRQRRQHHGPGRAADPVPRRARTWS